MNANKKHLVGGLFFIALVTLVILLFLRFTMQNAERIQQNNMAYAEDSAQQIATRVEEQFKSAEVLIQAYAYFLEASLKSATVSQEALAELERTAPFDGIRFTDLSGLNYAATGETTDTNDREFYIKGIEGQTGIAVINKSRVFNQPVLTFYTPLRYKGKIIGVLHGSYLSEKYLHRLLMQRYFGKMAHVYLCEPDGTVLASSCMRKFKAPIFREWTENGIITPESASRVETLFAKNESGVLRTTDSEGADNISVIALGTTKLFLVQVFPKEVTSGMISRANVAGFQLELALLILFAAYGAFSMFRARREKRRLERENLELGAIIKGVNLLFGSRYCIVDLAERRYEYLSGGRPRDKRLPLAGPYQDFVFSLADCLLDSESRKDLRDFFAPEHLIAKFKNQDIVSFISHTLRSGRQEWVNTTAICLEREEGQAARVLFVSQDVTDVKERELSAQKRLAALDRKERQYKLALVSNALCSYEFNVSADELAEDVIQVQNDKRVPVLQFFGLSAPCRASDFLRAWAPMVQPESREDYARVCDMGYLLKRFVDGQQEIVLDYWTHDLSGHEFCARQAFYLTRDDVSGDVMVMSVVRDITSQVIEQREQTKALQDALMLARHANEAKSTFLSNMSHDIRTPMNAIIGFTTIAASHLDNKSQVRDCLAKVLSSSNHLLSLINDILDMSRIESGKMQIKEQECNISELMHNLVNIIQPQVKAKQMQLFIDTFDVTNEDIIADPLKLNQVFINLLGNAVKYTPAGGMISFRLTQKPAFRHGWADYVFEVRDNGAGMAEEFVKHIFEPFTRESTTTQSGIQGTGLGMAITKNIIEMMNGTIEVESAPDQGTCFTVTLTLKIQDVESDVAEVKSLAGLRALVVDDDFHVCDSVDKMLRKIGMRPEWTTSGREAAYRTQIAHDDKDPFQTFIIDWQMPDLNGVETARRIRAIAGEDAPIIILTAYEWADIEEEARNAGVTAFCAKPLFMSDLKNALLSSQNREEESKPLVEQDRFKGSRVLVVDDLEMNREIAEFILSESGFVVETAPDGTDAVEMVRKSPEGHYDVILMDVQMSTMDGYEATRAIRSLEREDVKAMPIIAMTANAMEEDKAQALKSGMNAHIAKPIDVRNFFDVLGKFLG